MLEVEPPWGSRFVEVDGYTVCTGGEVTAYWADTGDQARVNAGATWINCIRQERGLPRYVACYVTAEGEWHGVTDDGQDEVATLG